MPPSASGNEALAFVVSFNAIVYNGVVVNHLIKWKQY